MDSTLRFPVRCPVCARELLVRVPLTVVARALRAGDVIQLLADCHHVRWHASSTEVEQIREYFEAAKLSGQKVS